MKIIKVISEWKKKPSDFSQNKFGKVNSGERMVMAIVEIDGVKSTRHIKLQK